jgi:hypothetical protein
MLQGMASNIDFRLARGIASVAFAALALFADNAAAQKKAEPKPRSPEKLVEALFEADGWSPEGRREREDVDSYRHGQASSIRSMHVPAYAFSTALRAVNH